MLFEYILNPLFKFINFLVSLVPAATSGNTSFATSFLQFLGLGLHFFGVVPFVAVITNVLLWCGIDISWSIVEWCYKKVPGVD